MPKVMGSSGKVVDIQMLGVGEVVRRMREIGKDINGAEDLGVIKAGAFIEEEVKASIGGMRAEVKSVDTGLLANSIQAEKIEDSKVVVKANPTSYPNSSTTTTDTALFMEYGTSKILPRMHFRNTVTRNQEEVKKIISDEVVNVVK